MLISFDRNYSDFNSNLDIRTSGLGTSDLGFSSNSSIHTHIFFNIFVSLFYFGIFIRQKLNTFVFLKGF